MRGHDDVPPERRLMSFLCVWARGGGCGHAPPGVRWATRVCFRLVPLVRSPGSPPLGGGVLRSASWDDGGAGAFTPGRVLLSLGKARRARSATRPPGV